MDFNEFSKPSAQEHNYFYGQQSASVPFYRIPKALFTDPAYRELSIGAKTLYALMLDRMNLSAKNGWFDRRGRVYIIFTVAEIMSALGCGKQKSLKLLDELEKKGRLIKRRHQGKRRPNLIYVKNFMKDSPESKFKKCENRTS